MHITKSAGTSKGGGVGDTRKRDFSAGVTAGDRYRAKKGWWNAETKQLLKKRRSTKMEVSIGDGRKKFCTKPGGKKSLFIGGTG